ncbi:MAG: hypothetical protein DWQ10_05630 [Calditrichaeota bacterium]|nr:MAG: hypothetical protein DWQ10_05630 [Calditrichota bacterium]
MQVFSLLNNKRAAIDLGSSTVKILRGAVRKQKVQMDVVDLIDLVKEYGIASADELTDDVYMDCLRKAAWRYKLKDIAITLPANEALLRTMTFKTSMTEENVLESIEEEMASHTFEDIDDFQIACCELENEQETENEISMLACAVPHSLIDRYKSILADANLNPYLFDLDILAVYNGFYFSKARTLERPAILIHCGAEYSFCIIVKKGYKPFFRMLKSGGNDVVTRLMDDAGFTLREAEAFKRHFHSSKMKQNPTIENINMIEIYCEFAANLITEVRRSLQHYQVSEGVTDFAGIYICGGEARNQLLASLIHHDLKLPTYLWDPLQEDGAIHVKKSTIYNSHDGLHMASAFGALVHGD